MLVERSPADSRRRCCILGLSRTLASERCEKVEPQLVPALAHLHRYQLPRHGQHRNQQRRLPTTATAASRP